ncbi:MULTISPECIES: Na+/H+ antiporter subunit E [Rheinheimera]|uniref:Na+/H+ antiporter subunit E n=1 Tax=Rheinheimera marina TaxID=1774958 RepID=A0ABV9JM52_9GAMM
MWTQLWPTPVRSLMLFVLWLLLNNSVALVHLVVGLLLAWGIPLLSRRFRLVQPALKRPGLALHYALQLLWDIVLANLQVLRLVLGPNKNLRPGFVVFPLELENDLAVTILAGTVSLTPGTVSADVIQRDSGERILLLHVLDASAETELIDLIKQRYEKPLKEMF